MTYKFSYPYIFTVISTKYVNLSNSSVQSGTVKQLSDLGCFTRIPKTSLSLYYRLDMIIDVQRYIRMKSQFK